MQALLKILAIFAELVSSVIKQRETAKRDEQIQDIRNDPAGEFLNEFGGVRATDSEADVPGDQAGVEVGKTK